MPFFLALKGTIKGLRVIAASRSWLVPNGFALAEQRMADVVTPVSDAAGRTTSLVFDLTLKASAPGISAQRAERVRVPLLGRVQP